MNLLKLIETIIVKVEPIVEVDAQSMEDRFILAQSKRILWAVIQVIDRSKTLWPENLFNLLIDSLVTPKQLFHFERAQQVSVHKLLKRTSRIYNVRAGWRENESEESFNKSWLWHHTGYVVGQNDLPKSIFFDHLLEQLGWSPLSSVSPARTALDTTHSVYVVI